MACPSKPSGSQCPSTPAPTQCPSTPAGSQCPSVPAGSQCPSVPAGSQCPSVPAGSQCPSTPADTNPKTDEINVTYVVNFNSNGGSESGTPSPQKKTHDRAINLSIARPSRQGYKFIGWATGSTATSASYQPGDVYSANASVILYAVWKAIKILIDAGHDIGYNTINHQNFTYSEGDRMWDLQEMLLQELRNIGFTNAVRLRTSNVNFTTQGSTEIWQDWNRREHRIRGEKAAGYDLFIQLHTNATGKGTPVLNGPNYALVIQPTDEEKQTAFAEALATSIKDTMGLVENSQIWTDSYTAIINAYNSGCPMAFLVENSFHTDEGVSRWLNNDENLRKLAKAYAKIIAIHLT